jgi:nucleotide-binding universal stress UspA family protein
MYRNILIATDGSDLATRAAKQGVGLAKAVAAKVTAVSVVVPYHWFDPGMAAAAETAYAEGAKQAASSALDAVADAAKGAGVACETVRVEGEHPYKSIIDTAKSKNCDLIVMASHGRRGVSAVLLGSETVKVLTHSKIPVLVYR